MVRSRCDKRSSGCARSDVGHLGILATVAKWRIGSQASWLCGPLAAAGRYRAQPAPSLRSYPQAPVQQRMLGRPTSASHGDFHVQANVGGDHQLPAVGNAGCFDRLVTRGGAEEIQSRLFHSGRHPTRRCTRRQTATRFGSLRASRSGAGELGRYTHFSPETLSRRKN